MDSTFNRADIQLCDFGNFLVGAVLYVTEDQQDPMLFWKLMESLLELMLKIFAFKLLEGGVLFRRLIVHFIERLMVVTMSTMMTIVQIDAVIGRNSIQPC